MHHPQPPRAPEAPCRRARVLARHRDRWIVLPDGDAAPVAAILAGRLRHDLPAEATPLVGDHVDVDAPGGDAPARIVGVHPRRGVQRRQAPGGGVQALAANVDLAFIVVSAALPVSPRRLERWCTIAWDGGAVPVVVLAKADAAHDLDAALAAARAAVPGVDVLALSARTGAGLDALFARLVPGRTAVLLGASGVGKSTLVNRLLGDERLRTRDVRGDGAGRHTTTHRELVVLPGGAALVDTPGVREVEPVADAADPDAEARHAAWLSRRDDPVARARARAAGREGARAMRAHQRRKRGE